MRRPSVGTPRKRGSAPQSEAAREMEHLHATAALMRSHPEYRAPQRIVETVKTIVKRDLAVFRDKS